MPLNNSRTDKIADLFGHTLSAEEILSLYPCDTGTFEKEDYNNPDLTITYDIHTAYDLRIKNFPFIVRGNEYKNNHKAFVFCKPRRKAVMRKDLYFYMENRETKKKKVWKPRPRYMGVVTSWNRERKYGFIRCYDDGQSYFAHCTQLTDDYELIRGSIVEFEIWQSKQEPEKVYAAKILVCEVPESYGHRKR